MKEAKEEVTAGKKFIYLVVGFEMTQEDAVPTKCAMCESESSLHGEVSPAPLRQRDRNLEQAPLHPPAPCSPFRFSPAPHCCYTIGESEQVNAFNACLATESSDSGVGFYSCGWTVGVGGLMFLFDHGDDACIVTRLIPRRNPERIAHGLQRGLFANARRPAVGLGRAVSLGFADSEDEEGEELERGQDVVDEGEVVEGKGRDGRREGEEEREMPKVNLLPISSSNLAHDDGVPILQGGEVRGELEHVSDAVFASGGLSGSDPACQRNHP